jgi:exonuclease SbcC
VNSAFIRQGNAGEFSQKSPKERKEILGNILGLGLYDQLRKLAAEQARSVEADRQTILKLQERLQQDLLQVGEFLQQKQQIQEQLELLQLKIKQLEEQRLLAGQKQQELQVLQQQVDQWIQQVDQVQSKYQIGLERLQQLRAAWRQLLRHLTKTIDRSALIAQQVQLTAKLNNVRSKQLEFITAREKLVTCKEQLHQHEQQMVLGHAQQVSQIKRELEKQQLAEQHYQAQYQINLKLQLQLQAEQLQVQQLLLTGQETCAAQLVMQKQFERSKEFYQRFIGIGNAAKSELDELKRKEQFLDDDCPSCPLCEQNLSAARKRFLADQLASQAQFAQRRIGRIAQVLAKLKAQIFDQHAKLEQLNQHGVQLQTWQLQLDAVNVRLIELDKIVVEQSAQIQILQSSQKTNLEKLVQLEQEREGLLSQDSNLQFLRQQIEQFEQVVQVYQVVDETVITKELDQIQLLVMTQDPQELNRDRQQILGQVAELVQNLKGLKIQQRELQMKLERASLVSQELQAQQALRQQLDQQLHDFQREHLQVTQQLGGVQARLEQLDQLQIELRQLQKNLQQLEATTQDYKALVSAFGKDGIPALLIEEAIPEIEQEANQLLGRLTDYQAQLFIESLRDLKSGGSKETLDIKISDSAGLRPYEMFSGGEAFRIDFALRIAISKLLARRAGTALQTLIIDEGFGSQDEEGLSHIMDAIYKIQADFAKIMIVSHLPSMKEQFPVHFQVQKTPSGSSVSVIELG